MEQMEIDGASIPGMINDLGYAFATTSYPINGLAVNEGIQDIRALNQFFANNFAIPNHVYLSGASEGGQIAALVI